LTNGVWRDLAYRIDKQSKGVYALLRYQATGRAVEDWSATSTDRRYTALFTVRTEENAITNPNPAAVRAHTEQARHVTEENRRKDRTDDVEPKIRRHPMGMS